MKGKRSVDTIVRLHPGDAAMNRNNNRWQNDEMRIVVKCFRRHGKNFQAIAEVLGTKNEQQVRNFYATNRKKFHLDGVIKEYEEEQQREQARKASHDAAVRNTSKTFHSNSNNSDMKRSHDQDSSGDVMEVSYGVYTADIQRMETRCWN